MDRTDLRSEHRTPEVERMVRFGYYLGIAANLIEDGPKVQMLVDSDYLDPRDVLREASEWCYGPGRAAALSEGETGDDPLVQCEGCTTLLDDRMCEHDIEGCPLCDECWAELTAPHGGHT